MRVTVVDLTNGSDEGGGAGGGLSSKFHTPALTSFIESASNAFLAYLLLHVPSDKKVTPMRLLPYFPASQLALRIRACALMVLCAALAPAVNAAPMFSRVANFEAAANVPAGRNISKKSVAEIVAASPDGNTLVYTDGEQQGIGFIDSRNPSAPKAMGFVPVAGEPTSVVVAGGVVLAAVSSTQDFTRPSGSVVAIDLKTRAVLASCDVGGHPPLRDGMASAAHGGLPAQIS